MSAAQVEAGEHVVLLSEDPAEILEPLVDTLAADPELAMHFIAAIGERQHLYAMEAVPPVQAARWDAGRELTLHLERCLDGWSERLRQAFTVRLMVPDAETLAGELHDRVADLIGQALRRRGLDDEPIREPA